jgi:hypothetical protein
MKELRRESAVLKVKNLIITKSSKIILLKIVFNRKNE